MRRLLLLCYLVTAGVVGGFPLWEKRFKGEFDFDWEFLLKNYRQDSYSVVND